MVMWIHWNVRGSRPALAFAHLPSSTARPWSPARPWHRGTPQATFPAGTGPSWGAQRHQNSPGKGLRARNTLLAAASAVAPVGLGGGSVPSQLCVPA